MNLRWTLNRLQAMGAREIAHRGLQYLRTRGERAGLGLATPVPANSGRGKPWLTPLPAGLAAETYTTAADRILDGQFRLFGTREWPLGFPPQWNRDPQSGTRAPLVFGKLLNYRNTSLVGNIKYLWEPNRHLELVTLAQAWRLTRAPRYANGCRMLVESWLEQCPYMMGANWANGLELALRLVNWSFAWHLLDADDSVLFSDPAGQAFKQRWLNAVRQHCHFIAGFPSLYSSANNHLLGELLGLLIGATTWPCWPESPRWRAHGLRQFEVQALLQNTLDGVNREQGIWYHHEVADMMLLAGLTARANGYDFSPEYWTRLEAMLDFIASSMDAGGHVPAFGDSDDAVMVRFCPVTDFCVYRSLLATGSVLFGRGDFKFKARQFDDKSRWLLGDAAAAQFNSLAADASAQRLRRSFQAGGYRILGSDFETAREVRLVMDAAPLGYLALAAHGHADALSFTLSVAGRPLLIDPGTYCYHTAKRWRDYFRGTSAHNTIRVDGADQSVPGGNFLWLRHANARFRVFESDTRGDRVVAEHDGYQRLDDAVLHRREIIYERAAAQIKVIDDLVCKTAHHIEIFWHFDPECSVVMEDGAVRVVREQAGLLLRWPEQLRAELVSGREDPCLGWASARFDVKVPCNTLVISGDVGGKWRGTSTLTLTFGSG